MSQNIFSGRFGVSSEDGEHIVNMARVIFEFWGVKVEKMSKKWLF